jgi:ribonuclease P protein component
MPTSPVPTSQPPANPAPAAPAAVTPAAEAPAPAAAAVALAPEALASVAPAPTPAVPTPAAPTPAAPGRLTRRAEFLRVAKGRRAPMPGLVLQVLPRGDDAPARLGFTVTKKVGNAVVRNRTRRRLKEAARLLLSDHQVTGADLVLVGREATRARPFATLQDDLRRALAKSGLL